MKLQFEKSFTHTQIVVRCFFACKIIMVQWSWGRFKLTIWNKHFLDPRHKSKTIQAKWTFHIEKASFVKIDNEDDFEMCYVCRHFHRRVPWTKSKADQERKGKYSRIADKKAVGGRDTSANNFIAFPLLSLLEERGLHIRLCARVPRARVEYNWTRKITCRHP